jgi:hypothetical protein
MPITYGLLSQGAQPQPQQSMIERGLASPDAMLALGATLLQASGQGMGTAEGLGTGLQAFSQSLAQAEAQKQKIRSQQIEDITKAAQADNLLGGGFAGNGIQAQMATMQMRRYMAQGMPQDEARYRAGQDVMMSTPQFTTDYATGQTIQVPRNPLPYVGLSPQLQNSGQPALMQAPISAPITSAPLPPVSPMTSPQVANEVAGLFDPTGNAPIVPFGPQAMTAPTQQTMPIMPTASMQAPIAAPMGDPSANLTPVERRARDEQETKNAVAKMEELQTTANNASDGIAAAEQAINALSSGFTSGITADIRARFNNTLPSANPTPEEAKFMQDYAVIDRYTGTKTLENAQKIKPISNTDIQFLKDMAGSTSQSPAVLRTKIMFDYAVSKRAQEKTAIAQDWVAQYGTLAKRNEEGKNFDQYIGEVLGGKLITPELSKKFGALYYINDEKEAESLPAGITVYNLKNKKQYMTVAD